MAEEVSRKARCPVTVVKTPLGTTTEAEREATANPGAPIDVRPLGSPLVSAHTRTLVRTNEVEVVRLVVRAGQDIPAYKTEGGVIVHCPEGRVVLTALGKTQVLEAGKLRDLPAGEPYAFMGIEDASLLLTTLVRRR